MKPVHHSNPIKAGALEIARELHGAGHTVYFAGGCVRDELMGEHPADYDIATSALPEQVAAMFRDAKGVGAHFGVILIRRNRIDYEIATFREEYEYSDGRRPDAVHFSTPERDAQRRDFTINGLFEDPFTGEIIDHVGGQDDIARGIVRCIGDPDHRFAEDHLRLLRAVRFAARFNYEIDSDTWQAICEHALRLKEISPERIRDELSRILVHPSRLRGFDLLVESGLMKQIIPEIYELQGCEQPPRYHPEGDVFQHVRLMLEKLPEDTTLGIVLAVLLHDIAKPATRQWDEKAGRYRFNNHAGLGATMSAGILRRLRYSNAIIDSVCETVARHMDFMHVQQMRQSTLRRFIGREHFADELELHRVDCLGSHGKLDNWEFLTARIRELQNQPPVPPRILSGHHLLELGYPAGREMGAILRKAQDLQLEGSLATTEEAIAWALREYPPDKPLAQDQTLD
jgi:poly(A) polymerase